MCLYTINSSRTIEYIMCPNLKSTERTESNILERMITHNTDTTVTWEVIRHGIGYPTLSMSDYESVIPPTSYTPFTFKEGGYTHNPLTEWRYRGSVFQTPLKDNKKIFGCATIRCTIDTGDMNLHKTQVFTSNHRKTGFWNRANYSSSSQNIHHRKWSSPTQQIIFYHR